MGRTVPSFRMLLEGIIGELSDFRRALRGEDRVAFDTLMNKAREHASSCTVVPTLDPMHAIFLSILVEQEKELIHLNKSLSNKESIISNNPNS
jgi:hypothetical protein